eukprot:CCRYP_009519-RA/>CCRYP_009519-RA protein AED:0.07 eAED:0.07 QI:508/0.5/0.33/1/0.5/0.66/3/0/1145
MSSRHDESSMSSLSAGLSAYNAAEPKPMSSASVRSRQSQQRSYGGPPPPRNGGNSVADSYRQPRSVEGRSAQSVASALSHGSAGRSRRGADLDDDDRSNNTERLVGLVNELTSGGSEDDRRRQMQMDEERYRLQSEIRSQMDNSFDSRSRLSGRNSRGSRQSMDPEADRSVMSGVPPPPPRSVRSGSSRRFDPDGMSHEFGADDPDGRHYAPALNPRQQPVRGPPSVHSRSIMDDQSNVGQSVASSRQSRSYYDDGTMQEEESYYSHDSRQSTMMSAPPPRLSAEASQFTNGDEESYYSRDSRGSRTYQSSKKARPVPVKETNENKRAMWWYNFSRCVTFPVPSSCIRKDDPEAKQAWREKVAICFCVFLASAFFVGIFGFIPVLLCQERTVYTLENVQDRTEEEWIVVNGNVYEVTELFNRHPTGPQGIEAFLHDDASSMFPRIPPALLPPMCLNTAKIENNEALQNKEPICSDFTDEDKKNGLPCHTFVTGINETAKYLGEFERVCWLTTAQSCSRLLTLTGSPLMIECTTSPSTLITFTKQIEKDHPMAYLEPTLNNLVINKLNEDATELFLSVYPDDRILGCMDELFYVGIIDTRFDVVCFILNVLMYFLLSFVAVIMVAQMICSLMYIAKGTRTYSEEDTQDQVMVMVPCYNEGGAELIKTIDSVIATTYPEENKVIFIIADGVVTGAGQELSTPEHLSEILGFEMDPQNDELYEYDSIGLLTTNKARVYHGYYEVDDRSLKYLVVVKHGLPMEQTGSAKPGNRGKRDSQLVLMGYFNRIYHGRELNELDAAIEDALIDLNMQSDDMRLLMTIDADTRVDEMSLTHMTYAMNQNDRILALCGETKVDNKWQSWVTMMQVFEYYNNHHMKKGFESAFGCVTCLPGCFSMYRILNDDGKPLLADDHVYAEYLRNDIDSLHEQNLFHLGEDRMLTTLLLHFFPGMFLSYVPEAQCWTIVPHTMRILLSQRRRWINSTYHNLLELTKVKTMCGVCCCSMKTVVYLDLIACMILPASTVYAVYLIFLVAAGKTKFSLLLLVLYGLLIGVQLVVFIVRSRYDFLFWFIFFTIIGVPVFYFVLPLYAFWHMDDFSWGETRKVAAMKESFNKPPPPPEETDEADEDSDEESEAYSRDSRSRGSKRSFT